MDDADPIPLTALQCWAFCPRQFGLIHLEQAFDDNLHTLREQAMHRRVDAPGMELRRGLRIERALHVWRDALGPVGQADVVEFEPDGTPDPVEYKHGSRHKAAAFAACDDLQLAAQALCLAEMTGHTVRPSQGARGLKHPGAAGWRPRCRVTRPSQAARAPWPGYAAVSGSRLRAGAGARRRRPRAH